MTTRGFLIVALGLVASTVFAADKDVIGEITQLNKPGSIVVRINIGRKAGVRTGDIMIVKHRQTRVGMLKVTSVESDHSFAAITEVEGHATLQTGDEVTKR